jgi:hypothetical protein
MWAMQNKKIALHHKVKCCCADDKMKKTEVADSFT